MAGMWNCDSEFALVGSLAWCPSPRFYHYTQKATTFSAAVEPAPGHICVLWFNVDTCLP